VTLEKSDGTKEINCLSNRRGQLAIEAVLLLSVLITGFILFTKTVREKQLLPRLFNAPITSLKNMAGYGTWRETCQGLGSSKSPQRLSNCHPNSITRALSSDPN